MPMTFMFLIGVLCQYVPSLAVLYLSGVSIVAYTGAAPGGNGTYPENELPANAFSSQSNLTSIQLPPTITSIGESAFSGCKLLTSTSLPQGLTFIGASAFNNCSALTSITIPANITISPRSVFANTSLTSVDGYTGSAYLDRRKRIHRL